MIPHFLHSKVEELVRLSRIWSKVTAVLSDRLCLGASYSILILDWTPAPVRKKNQPFLYHSSIRCEAHHVKDERWIDMSYSIALGCRRQRSTNLTLNLRPKEGTPTTIAKQAELLLLDIDVIESEEMMDQITSLLPNLSNLTLVAVKLECWTLR